MQRCPKERLEAALSMQALGTAPDRLEERLEAALSIAVAMHDTQPQLAAVRIGDVRMQVLGTAPDRLDP